MVANLIAPPLTSTDQAQLGEVLRSPEVQQSVGTASGRRAVVDRILKILPAPPAEPTESATGQGATGQGATAQGATAQGSTGVGATGQGGTGPGATGPAPNGPGS